MPLEEITMPKTDTSTGPQTWLSSSESAVGSLYQDFAPGLEAAFPECFQESDDLLRVSEGYVPDYVRGTWYLNGPARFGRNGLAYRHWLDGDGMICALRFNNDGVRLKSRYVRSRKFSDEQNAGRPLFRTFGTAFDGSRMNRAGNALESPVNVSVYAMGDRLLAFGEQGLPWELDPETLETRGQFTFNGRLNDASPFSAHPKFDSNSGEMFNFGIFFSAQSPRLYFYCFDAGGLRYRKAVPLEYPCSIHDFTLSKNYAVFYLSPCLLDAAGLLHHGRTVMDCLHWVPEHGSKLLILARDTGDVVALVPLGNRYCLHLINSFEERGRLKVDVLEFDEPLYSHYQPVPNLFENVPSGGPVRYVVDLQSRELLERIVVDYSRAPDFPSIDPRLAMHPYDEFWMLGISAAGNRGRKFFDRLVHVRWSQDEASDAYQSPPMRYLGGEPVFIGVPDSGCAEGVVICQEFDASEQQSYVALFDARRLSDGPLGRIAMDRTMYLGFHATFQSNIKQGNQWRNTTTR